MKSFDPHNYAPKALNKITLAANIITLSGSSTAGHSANITINGVLNLASCSVPVSTSLADAATAWCAANYDYFKVKGFLVNNVDEVITIIPAHSWDTVNRIDATILTATGTLTGTYSSTLVIDGSKARIWEVTFTTATANLGIPLGLKDKDEVQVIFKTTVGTVVTLGSYVVINGGISTLSLTAGSPHYFTAFYDVATNKLIEPFNDLGADELAADSVTTSKILDKNVTSAKLADTLNLTTKVVAFSIKAGTPVNAVAAAGLLTLTGVVKDGETITVGTEVYEIDTDGVFTGGRTAIDVSTYAVAAQGTLTVTAGGTQIANNDTVTLGSKTYTFKTAAPTVEGEILIGASDTAALLNLKNAINHTGTPGTDYFCAAVHPTVTGTSSDATTLIVTAKTPGTIGNAIVATEVAAELSWDGAGVLGTTRAGSDCSAANADGVIVTRVTATSAIVVATQGTGTTVLFTSKIKGVIGNGYAFAKVLTNGSVDHDHLGTAVLGVNGTVGAALEIVADDTNVYIASAVNTIADANWKKLVLQTL